MTKTGKRGFYPVAGYLVWIGLFGGERERERYYDFVRCNSKSVCK